ncbi:SDR family NAD(P)-dependent oxidoreductase [uncultured Microbacterium sp.]|uniref:SDR family NAD(P)-dependent oxidoreductase n=1 Tax=uncultured Microbacterium sp. TaxID=191216 RepID=UPI0025EE42F3|nr:SDR family NAD(P)-dependent oxidoreductase [uncultured Microbacterium sp.]
MSRDSSPWDPTNLPDLEGRTYLVTGGNAGIGFFASEQLAGAGAHVILSGRNPNRLQRARAAIERRVPGASVESLLLDTSNLGSVRAAAATVRTRKKLDGLLLNAGIVHPPRTRDENREGNELVLATNALGHWALAGELLLPLAAARGRIVWLGSISTSMWRYDPVDAQLRERYSPWRAYVQSKVVAMALGFEAHRRLVEASIPVGSVVAHPGFSVSGRTAVVRGVNEPSRRTQLVDGLQAAVTQSKERGAWAPVRALIDPDVHSGDYIGPRRTLRGEPVHVRAAAYTRSIELGSRVWELAESATRYEWPLKRGTRPRWADRGWLRGRGR